MTTTKCGRGKRAGKQKCTNSHTTVCIDYANGLCTIKRSKCKYLHVVFSSPMESNQCDSYVLTGKCLLGDQCPHYHPCRTGVEQEMNRTVPFIQLDNCSVDQVVLLLVQHLQDTHVHPTSVVNWLLAQSHQYPSVCAQITHHLCELVPHHCSSIVVHSILNGIGMYFFDPYSTPETRDTNFTFLEELYTRGVAKEEHVIAATCTLQAIRDSKVF